MAYAPPCHLSEIINLYPKEESTCIGYARTQGRRCRNSVKAEDRAQASFLLEKATKRLCAGHSIDSLLEDIAYWVLCKRWHRNSDVAGISAEWRSQVYRYLAVQASPSQHINRDVSDHRSSTFVTYEVSHRDVNAAWSLKVTRPLSTPDSYQPIREPPRSLPQSQPQRETRPPIHNNTIYPSSLTSSSSSTTSTPQVPEDPSSDMFARTQRARRVLMPTSRLNRTQIQPNPVPKKEPRTGTKVEAKASSSLAPLQKANRGPPLQYLKDQNRILDEYMDKLRRMEPPEDTTDLEEDTAAQEESHKSELATELRSILSASGSAAAPLASASRATQTSPSREILERRRTLDEYIAEVKLMKPGEDDLETTTHTSTQALRDIGIHLDKYTQTPEPPHAVEPVEDTANIASDEKPSGLEIDQAAPAPEPSKSTDIVQTNETEDVESPSPSSQSPSQSLLSPSPSSSSITTLPTRSPSAATHQIDKNNNGPNPQPPPETLGPLKGSHDSPFYKRTEPPSRPYPVLTLGLVTSMAVSEGLGTLGRWMRLEGRGSVALFWVFVYLWGLSSVGLL
ncbi:hypothetical protein P170DRAFT_440118 [Aspergillus steynii IBT 23096]|uniref:Uncharacterized protein n=1 Tax=Aspergillus steynii IBT 23096 TaxID=1392250 RepID=A0A2I2FW94_9EURO|nr:uncharacterized protein P170DRAFT_440118 [Aspergillus steynii IBT 23096]PLB44910.1 hypothetical protein P170DRAFT_440118 [Aspergillus steynii IBT 23096]